MKIRNENHKKETKVKKEFTVEKHFSVKEVARHLSLSTSFVQKLCSCGQINASNVATEGYSGKKRHWIIPESELAKFLIERKVLIKPVK